MGLKVNLVLLVDRDSTMGPIEAATTSTMDHIKSTNGEMTILLAFVVAGALGFAVVISWMLTVSLSRLAFGMDMLVRLSCSSSLLLPTPIPTENLLVLKVCRRGFFFSFYCPLHL